MNVFYNYKGIGDTLLVSLKEIDKQNRGTQQRGDVAVLFDKESKETAGYHIFHASSYGKINQTGMCALTDELKNLINHALTENGLEQHNVSLPEEPPFIVGLVTEKKNHPDADKLSVCQVDTGTETLQIVCGAPNVKKGQKVVVAKPGAVMPSGMKIKKSKLRGVSSSGMICSAKELVLPDAPSEKGILELDSSYTTGGDFLMQYHEQ
ncbi:YtpR family tRNA-binding protein [Salibacterium halotolerans]|uniref:tRNA-binding protein n=1 Tax=Salibacterium halotolerans TaxID=1884432 RepID=A0A1I5VKR9_9BACI|nr:DUF4479 family protein [Salibacterium halotolerans]SFQ08168.1 tRNA-binding protein [Salibacterium halotolerans]